MFDFPSSPSVGQVYQPASGPSWVWDGTVWKSYQSAGETAIQRTFIPGAQTGATIYNYSKPANLRQLEVEGVSAGGSGAPAIATSGAVWSFGSGGGGGSWGKKLFQAAALPALVAITIGQAGQGTSSGSGQTAADTTFGSLITLPGGRAGNQGSNTATSTWAIIGGSGPTSMPTGVDVGKPGEGSEGCTVGSSVAGGGISAIMGRAGKSPWGDTFYTTQTTGQNSTAGTGYGWGSGPSCGTNVALKSSITGGPGAILLTEYLAVAPVDVAAPLRQTFLPTSTGFIIPVPPTAKAARIRAHFFGATANLDPRMRYSLDGVNFIQGASEYVYGGSILYTGSSGSPTKVAAVAASYLLLCGYTDRTDTALYLDITVITQKLATAQAFGFNCRGSSYHGAATAGFQETFYQGYPNHAGLGAATQLAAIQIYNAGGTFSPSGGLLTADWIY